MPKWIGNLIRNIKSETRCTWTPRILRLKAQPILRLENVWPWEIIQTIDDKTYGLSDPQQLKDAGLTPAFWTGQELSEGQSAKLGRIRSSVFKKPIWSTCTSYLHPGSDEVHARRMEALWTQFQTSREWRTLWKVAWQPDGFVAIVASRDNNILFFYQTYQPQDVFVAWLKRPAI